MPLHVAPGIRPGSHCFYDTRNGFSYHKNRVMNGGRISLRCALAVSEQCHGRASCSRTGRNFRMTQPHNHPSEPETFEARQLREAIISRCRDPDSGRLSLKEIYDEERRSMRISAEAAAHVPFQKLRSSMARARYERLPNVPRTLNELRAVLLNPQYAYLTATVGGHGEFYAGTFGSTDDGTRCMMFASRLQLKCLRNAKQIFSDATFSSVPAGLEARQLWNIITVRRGRIIPLVRVLMQTKQEECYMVALRAVRRLVPGFSPRIVNCDFERGQMNAWKRAFPQAHRRGCLFHFAKNVIKQARKIGLIPHMREDEEVNRLIRMVCALPLLRTNQLRRGLFLVARRATREGRYQLLRQFFDDIYRIWMKPEVLAVLSVFGADHRTSNACESDNATVARTVRAPHPCIWRFLGGLASLEDMVVQDLAVLRRGGNPSRRRRASTINNDARIRAFTEDLEEGNISLSNFLRQASHRLHGAIQQFVS